MRDRLATRIAAPLVWLALAGTLGGGLAALAGCARGAGPRAIRSGEPCATCGMAISEMSFACERAQGRDWRVYDSIECLLRQGATEAYLADYDTKTLHDADSMWVVQGDFPSPMGGGMAAFIERAAADTIAARTHGRVDRLAAFAVSAGAP